MIRPLLTSCAISMQQNMKHMFPSQQRSVLYPPPPHVPSHPTASVPHLEHLRRELDVMADPEEAYRRRGSHWTFNGKRFLRDVGEAKKAGRGSFPGFDHAVGDPVENALQVYISYVRE